MREIISSIITELPATTTFVPIAATPRASNKKKEASNKSPVSTPRASSKRKKAQPYAGAATMRAPEEPKPKKKKTIQSKVIEVAGTPRISPTRRQKKKQPVTAPLVHQRSI